MGYLDRDPVLVHAVDRWRRAWVTYRDGRLPYRLLVLLSALKFRVDPPG